MSAIQLHFLGVPQFQRDNQPLKLTKNKGIALLLYLSVKGTTQTREQLMDLLWPDSLPQASRKNMRNTLWYLRKTLGEQVIHIEAEYISLGPTVWVDLHNFEKTSPQTSSTNDIQTATALYRASLAEGLYISESQAFELWLTTAREQVGQHYLRLLDALVGKQQTAHNWQQVINTAQQAVAHDNLQEPMYRAMMEAHARLDERREALQVYATLQTILTQELDVKPLSETETLRQDILKGDLQAVDRRPQHHVVILPSPAAPRPQPSPFIGRQAEKQSLHENLQQARHGQARVVMISGELGIGKSRLWEMWSSILPQEVIVLETRCLDTTQALPFALLTRLFNQSHCFDRLFQPSTAISMTWLAELSRFYPEIRDHLSHIPLPPHVPPEEERRRLFEAFSQLFLSLASQPLLLFIDDLHWADQATLDWLIYLMDRLGHKPFLLVGTYRSSEAPSQLNHIVATWNREGISQHLALQRLTLKESTALIVALGEDITLAQQHHQQSAGNPYFLIELNRVGPGDTPAELVALLHERLKRLSNMAQQVMQAAAILEAGFDLNTLRQTSGRGEEEILNALDELLQAIVFVEKGNHYEFAHPLVGEVVRQSLSLARRQFLNRRAAEALESTYSANLAPVAGRIATHYAETHKTAVAAHYAAMAGAYALELAAIVEALKFYRQALALDPSPSRRMELGWVLFILSGERVNARETLERALAEFKADHDVAGVVKSCLKLAFTFLPSGEGQKIIAWVDRALPYLEEINDPEAEAEAHFLLGAGTFRVGRPMSEAQAHFEEARRLASKHQVAEVAMGSWFESGNLLIHQGDFERARQAFKQSLHFAQNNKFIYQETISYNNLAYVNLLAGQVDDALLYLKKGLDVADNYALSLPRQYLYSTQGEIALTRGKLNQAERWFKQAISVAEQFDSFAHIANIQANLGLVAQARGMFDEALTLLHTAQAALDASANAYLYAKIELWLAELYLQRDEKTVAQAVLSQAEARLRGNEYQGLNLWAKRVRATLL